jgi:hypothetical protein
MKPVGNYTCAEYRQEMMLLGMKRQLEDPGLPESERIRIAERVRELEQQMGWTDPCPPPFITLPPTFS